MLTIFTPTYNRAYRLPTLYESLRKQTVKDFEWIVVDDGSTDETEELFKTWQKDVDFTITYIHQANGGKHRAVNRGVKMAKGELFFIVDSDDYLTNDAVELIQLYAPNATTEAGLCFRKSDYNGTLVGNSFPSDLFFASSLELAYKMHVIGDKAEVFRTTVLREYPFPEIEGEIFVPEALVWNRIATQYRLYCVDRIIYRCEYLPDGLSKGFSNNLKRNPKGFGLYYKETMQRKDVPLLYRLKYSVRYLQCLFYQFSKKEL